MRIGAMERKEEFANLGSRNGSPSELELGEESKAAERLLKY